MLAAPLSWRGASAVVALVLAFLAATNRWMSFSHGFVYARANDEGAYLKIAHAAPSLLSQRIADQHAQRWPVHWMVGTIADLGGWQVEIVYRYAAIALVLAACLTLAAVLIRLRVSTAIGAVCILAMTTNPYALRYYGLAPGYLADLAFDFGVGLTLLGLIGRRLPFVLAGLLIGIVSRQTMLPVVFVVVLWIALSHDWRDEHRWRWLASAGAALAVPLAAYLVVHHAAADFSQAGTPLGKLTIYDALTRLPGSAHDLANHFAHVVNGLFVVAALLIVTLPRCRWSALGASFWGSLAVGLAIALQSAALNPDPINNDFNSSNEPRLTALALVPLVVAVAVARVNAERETARPLATAPLTVAALAAVMLIGSLHHEMTWVSTGSRGGTLALEVLVGLVVLVLAAVSDRRRPVDAAGFEPATSRV